MNADHNRATEWATFWATQKDRDESFIAAAYLERTAELAAEQQEAETFKRVALDLREQLKTAEQRAEALQRDMQGALEEVPPKYRQAMEAKVDALQQRLNEILCIIHRDGGHYIQKHGEQNAYEDACTLLHEWKLLPERLAGVEAA